jgi:hypothetical protein
MVLVYCYGQGYVYCYDRSTGALLHTQPCLHQGQNISRPVTGQKNTILLRVCVKRSGGIITFIAISIVLLDTNAAGMIIANQELLLLPFLLINQPCNFCATNAQNQTGVAKVMSFTVFPFH